MRIPALAALAALCAFVQPAAATGPCALGNDVTGDVVLAGQPATTGFPDDAADITGLGVATNGSALELTVSVVSLDRPIPRIGPAPAAGEGGVGFTVGGAT